MHLSGPGLAAKLRWQREPPGGQGCDEVTGLPGGVLETLPGAPPPGASAGGKPSPIRAALAVSQVSTGRVGRRNDGVRR
jgi:hypothetical protein